MAQNLIVIPENSAVAVARGQLPEAWGMRLYHKYGKQLRVKPPDLAEDAWILTARDWVGYIPLAAASGIYLAPKTTLQNLFALLGYAYDLPDFLLPEGIFYTESLPGFYEQLALVLAQRALDQLRRGLYRRYLPNSDRLPFVRGRLDSRKLIREAVAGAGPARGGDPARIPCTYYERSANIPENQILAWTLLVIARSGLCSPPVMEVVSRAYRAWSRAVTLRAFNAGDPAAFAYNRLNQDYQPLHALARFFLANTIPGIQPGTIQMIPFLVEMPRLFEAFVAAWTRVHLPAGRLLRAQERIQIGDSGELHAQVDLILYDRDRGEVQAVLDTKYKADARPQTADIFQVAGYANLKGCREAWLIYPAELARPLDVMVGTVRVRSLVFDLSRPTEQAGAHFLAGLLAN